MLIFREILHYSFTSLSDPYQTYKIPLKTDGQSIIEHNLVTIYLNFEWPDNADENPNLLLHIFEKSKSFSLSLSTI